MSVTVPNAISLASIPDGSAIVASDHRNNYSAVQVGVNGLIAMFAAAPSKGDLLLPVGASAWDRLGVGANGQVLTADSAQTTGMKWASAAGITYRKTTAKAVNTTVAATDLLNGEITVAAGAMGASGLLRLTAWGDWLQNIGTNQPPPRFQVVLGGTTMIDTNTQGGGIVSAATRQPWRLSMTILNLTASSQVVYIEGTVQSGANTAGVAAFTTGTGQYQPLGSSFLLQGNNAGLAVNTALAQALVLNVINGNGGAAYETKLLGALVEIL